MRQSGYHYHMNKSNHFNNNIFNNNGVNKNNNNTNNYNHVINDLQDYMFTNEFIYKYSIITQKNKQTDTIKYKPNDKNNIINTKKTNENIEHTYKDKSVQNKQKQEDTFSPHEKDKLFWCFYILQNGIDQYEFIKTVSFKTEKDYKFKTAEKIKDYKETFKSLKLKLVELQDEFVNQQSITIKGLISLCHIYNINILYIKKKTYYEILTNSTNTIHVIVDDGHNTHVPLNITDDMISSYKNNYWKIDNPKQPLKSISNYTVSELKEICNKLSIPIEKNGKKLIKQELYENILQFL